MGLKENKWSGVGCVRFYVYILEKEKPVWPGTLSNKHRLFPLFSELKEIDDLSGKDPVREVVDESLTLEETTDSETWTEVREPSGETGDIEYGQWLKCHRPMTNVDICLSNKVFFILQSRYKGKYYS